MELFKNLIYEYKKGMRDLALHTCEKSRVEDFIQILKLHNIAYKVCYLGENKVNLFFGNKICLELLEKFSDENLHRITPYEDFILGIMLGYSRNEQYNRILGKLCA